MKHTPAVALLLALTAGSLAFAQPEKKEDSKPTQPTQPQPKAPAKDEKPAEKPKEGGKPEDKKPEEKTFTIKLTSETIENNKQMPKKHTVDGDEKDPTKKHVSPALKWEGAPKETKEFALIMDDPDARGFVHWVVYKIPADVKELPEGLPNGKDNAELTTPVKITQGTSSFRQIGYLGPAARKGGGVHRYHFRLYALDKTLDLKPGATRKELDEAMKGHIIAEGQLIGTNER